MGFLGFLPGIIKGAVKGIKWIAKKIRERRERRRQAKMQKAFQAQQEKTANPWTLKEFKFASPWGKVQKVIQTGRDVIGKVKEGLQEEAANNEMMNKIAPNLINKASDMAMQSKEQELLRM